MITEVDLDGKTVSAVVADWMGGQRGPLVGLDQEVNRAGPDAPAAETIGNRTFGPGCSRLPDPRVRTSATGAAPEFHQDLICLRPGFS